MSGLVAVGATKLLPVLVRVGIVSVVMYFVTSGLLKKWRRQRKMTSEDDSRTLDALWRSYEGGEISWDEYEEESRDLKEG